MAIAPGFTSPGLFFLNPTDNRPVNANDIS